MNCDRDIQEELKESMKLPWQPRPFFRTNARDTTPQIRTRDRRAAGAVKRIRRIWWHYREAVGMFGWIIVGFMVAVMAWIGFIGVEGLLR